MTNLVSRLLGAMIGAAVLGCGSSGGAGGSGGDGAGGAGGSGGTSLLEGFLVDAPVAGVSYETPTQAGVTDERGTFLYFEGERVRFFVGDETLGEPVGQPQVTPFDLVGASEVPVGTGDIRRFVDSDIGRRMVNILLFLHTFDTDGQPGNGIEIGSEIAVLYEDIDLDFDQPWLAFLDSKGFRMALHAANEGALFDSVRRPRSPPFALEHLYEEFGIDPMLSGTSEIRRDEGADGSTDRIVRRTYDSRGFPLHEARDDPAGGLREFILTQEYDEAGFPTRLTDDSNDDGIPEVIQQQEYDLQGRLTERTFDQDADGTPEVTITTSYNLVGLPNDTTQVNSSGTRVEHFFYDERGNLVDIVIDADGDLDFDEAIKREYDTEDRLIRQAEDTDADGMPDEIRTIEYDADGNRIREALDDDADGREDSFVETFYDSEGRAIRAEVDRDADGTPDQIIRYTYDTNGLTLRIEFEEAGMPTQTSVFEYDANGNETRYEFDGDGDGTVDRLRTREYDENGYLTSEVVDAGADGDPDFIRTLVNDMYGNVLRVESDNEGDETVDRREDHDHIETGFGFLFFVLDD